MTVMSCLYFPNRGTDKKSSIVLLGYKFIRGLENLEASVQTVDLQPYPKDPNSPM